MNKREKFLPIGAMSALVTLVMLLLFATTAVAQTNATITPNQEAVTVGDPILLTVSVTHPAGSTVLFPELEPNWGDLVVRSQSAPQTADQGNGTAVTTQQIDVRLFALGAFNTPELPITIADSSGALSQTSAAPIPLTVQSVLVEGDSELRDIKPQAALPVPAIWPFIVLGTVAAAAIAALLIWQRRRQPAILDNRLPYEKALDALTHLDKQKYPANGRYKEQYAAVSDILRSYVETSRHIPLTDRTSAEMLPLLRQSNLHAADVQTLLLILEDADLVKFAKVQPSQHEAERLTNDARQFIQNSKPVETIETNHKSKSKPQKRKPNSVRASI